MTRTPQLLFLLLLLAPAISLHGMFSRRGSGLVAAAECYIPTQREDCKQFTCLNGRCSRCTNSSQCFFGGSSCVIDQGVCNITPVYRVTAAVGVGAAALLVMWGVITAVGSLGGGAGAVAGASLFLDVPVASAVAMILCHIIGTSSMRIPGALGRHHPTVTADSRRRPIINYQVLALFIPMSTFGIVCGKILDEAFLEIHRLVLLLVIQLTVIPFLFYKTVQRYRREKNLIRLQDGTVDYASTLGLTEMPTLNVRDIKNDMPQFPKLEVAIVVVCVFLGGGFRQFLAATVCLTAYQVAALLMAAVTFAAIFFSYRHHLSCIEERDRLGRPMRPYDAMTDTWIDKILSDSGAGVSFNFDIWTSFALPCAAVLVGISNVVVGQGSVVIFCLFALIKLHPEESAETNRLLTFLTVLVPCLENLAFHSEYFFHWSWAVLFAVCGAAGAILSIPIVRLVRQHQLFSLVIGSNVVVQLVSLGLSIALFMILHRINEQYNVPTSYYEHCF